jgi:hypothetical protein
MTRFTFMEKRGNYKKYNMNLAFNMVISVESQVKSYKIAFFVKKSSQINMLQVYNFSYELGHIEGPDEQF